MSERLRLVRDFGELRPGALVLVRGCRRCGGEHRRMLSSRRLTPDCNYVCAETHIACFGFFDIYQSHGELKNPHVCPTSVANGNVFLIDTGLEDSDRAEDAQHRPKPVKKSPGRLPKKERA